MRLRIFEVTDTEVGLASTLENIIDRIQARSLDDMALGSLLLSGVIAGAMMVIMTITYASLIFSGDLKEFLPQGMTLALSGVIVVGLIIAALSSSTHSIGQIDDDTAPVFALMLTMLIATLPTDLSTQELLLNLLVGIIATTIISGSVLTLFGVFKFGNFVQFLPYSVMGGYFASVGWLVLIGAIKMLSDNRLSSIADAKHLISAEQIGLWLPALILAIGMRILRTRLSTGILFAGAVILVTAGFYAIHSILGNTPANLMTQGLLVGPFDADSNKLFNPSYTFEWSLVHWPSVIGNAGSIASIVLISLLSIILAVSGLSLSTHRDLDVNYELKITGFANIIGGFMGGMSSLPSLTTSNLAYDIHPKPNRLIGVVAVLVALATFYLGMDLVAHLPKVVLGTLLIYIGLGFALEWIVDGYRKFGALEYSVIPIILIVSIFVGFLQSIVAGIVAAIVLFVIKYSRIRIIRYQASGATLRSNLVRDTEQNNLLTQHGHQIRLFTLQGYLFFGTAGSLYRDVLATVNNPDNAKLKYVILDFSQVIGVDSSATLNFEKLAQRLAERSIYLITTSLQPDVLEILRRGGLDVRSNAYLIQHIDLDQGLEWCENYILKEQAAEEMVRKGIFERMADALPQSDRLHRLSLYLNKVDVEAGQVLCDAGDDSDAVFFLETCTASAYIVDSRGEERRVSGAGRGAIFGEIGFFLDIPRTAKVRADTEGSLYRLETGALREMEKEEPELASAITRYLAQVVTERLVNTTQSLRSVL